MLKGTAKTPELKSKVVAKWHVCQNLVEAYKQFDSDKSWVTAR